MGNICQPFSISAQKKAEITAAKAKEKQLSMLKQNENRSVQMNKTESKPINTQKEIANLAGVSTGTVAQFEQGQMQENRKRSHGNNAERDESGKYLMGQNEPTGSTASQIAKEVGVSESTVKRAEKFSKGIDAIEKVSPEAADK